MPSLEVQAVVRLMNSYSNSSLMDTDLIPKAALILLS